MSWVWGRSKILWAASGCELQSQAPGEDQVHGGRWDVLGQLVEIALTGSIQGELKILTGHVCLFRIDNFITLQCTKVNSELIIDLKTIKHLEETQEKTICDLRLGKDFFARIENVTNTHQEKIEWVIKIC